MISLKEAIKFHGHLGPYLILGIIAGNLGLKKLGVKKYFDLRVLVYGANKKPKSCLIDGLQLSTGATYGKGNIQKYAAKEIKIVIRNLKNNKAVIITLGEFLEERLAALKGHSDSENFAKGLLKSDYREIFRLN
ncbi:MAG: formylmethanofuran dehydrogenase subunit E family protein [Candidatus Omnitrophota bacterium]|nr:formylmethanofuran dehydrogenase subunit E family protein [Candidatus Omnitrophota bacterium]